MRATKSIDTRSLRFAAAAWVALATILGASAPAARAAGRVIDRTEPAPKLSDTGLYSDPAAKVVARENLPFSPQYPLWTDGAAKRRWVGSPGTELEFAL